MAQWDTYETVAIRLGLALIVGAILGLNRWLHHKSAGIAYPCPSIDRLRYRRPSHRRLCSR
jgi:hypothetical protein